MKNKNIRNKNKKENEICWIFYQNNYNDNVLNICGEEKSLRIYYFISYNSVKKWWNYHESKNIFKRSFDRLSYKIYSINQIIHGISENSFGDWFNYLIIISKNS